MPKHWWWLSFADPERPRGKQFIGVAIVHAVDLASAMRAAWRSECNPGGQVCGSPMPKAFGPPPTELDHRLITNSTELDRLTRAWTGSGVDRKGQGD